MASKMSNTDDWQMEAVHKQFDVFESLVVPCHTHAGLDKVAVAVLKVISKHLQLSNAYVNYTRSNQETAVSVARTILQTCKNMSTNYFQFSFVVIVTNQNVLSKGLCKIPIFIVGLGNWSFFVDINSKTFGSWDAFMQENNLPACKFCFPLNGRYNVGGKLKIDFASSSAAIAQSLVSTSMFPKVVGKIIDVVQVAASCLIKVAPICLKVIVDLRPVAMKFVQIFSKMSGDISTVFKLLCEFNTKKRIVWDVMIPAVEIVARLSKDIMNNVREAWKDGKRILLEAYNQLRSLFPQQFASASESSRYDFLALTVRVDSEAMQILNEAKDMMSPSRSAQDKPRSVGFNDENNTTYLQSVFSNSITDCALQGGGKSFGTTTNEILTVTKEIADGQQSLDELKNIFESVSNTVFEEYRYKFKCYSKSLQAAKQASSNMDQDLYNESLDIKGNPQEHYMREVLQSSLKSLRCKYKITAKINELKVNSKIVLIPLVKMHSDVDADGLYRCIGVRGGGEFSESDLLDVLQEKYPSFSIGKNKNNSRSNSLDNITFVQSDEFSVLFSQEVNEENTCEGLLTVCQNRIQ